MGWLGSTLFVRKSGYGIALALCAMVFVSGTLNQLFFHQPGNSPTQIPDWLSIVAPLLAAGGVVRLTRHPRWLRIQGAIFWTGLLLMVWVANGLIFDLIHLMVPVQNFRVDWAGIVTRILALTVIILMARLILASQDYSVSWHSRTWYGYAAFVLALPYPVLRICWTFGGTIGITFPGAAGNGFTPLLFAIPWIFAAILSLFLVSPPVWMPRWLLLIAGWSATTIVAMIGPAACWSIVCQLLTDNVRGPDGMKTWVPCLFYSSWFLWAIAAGAATLSYQFRSATSTKVPDDRNFQKTL